ncbi:MAG TPA: hypothetical protein VF328_21920, partial [Mycobacterium sp.]
SQIGPSGQCAAAGRVAPQCAHWLVRRGRQRLHIGRPAATPLQGRSSPQTVHTAVGGRQQLEQMSSPFGPARWEMGRTRPHRPQSRAAPALTSVPPCRR